MLRPVVLAGATALLWLLATAIPGRSAGLPSENYEPASGEHQVAVWRGEWRDAARNRIIPVKIYYPGEISHGAPAPVIVFSHGLGGSREGYRYLGEYWAAHGYVSVHLQHPGSDETLWKGRAQPVAEIAAAAADPRNIIDRPMDVKFVIDRLTVLNSDTAFVLHDRLDLGHIGMAGHSFGAYTTLALAGQKFRMNAIGTLADPRIKAAVAMSTPVPAGTATLSDAYARIAIPVFHLTGTSDSDRFGTSDPALRRLPYDRTRNACAWLLTLEGGDHMVFSGLRRRGDGKNDAVFHQLIQEGTTAFWDMTLRGDVAAQRWLEQGGFVQRLGRSGTFEQKKP